MRSSRGNEKLISLKMIYQHAKFDVLIFSRSISMDFISIPSSESFRNSVYKQVVMFSCPSSSHKSRLLGHRVKPHLVPLYILDPFGCPGERWLNPLKSCPEVLYGYRRWRKSTDLPFVTPHISRDESPVRPKSLEAKWPSQTLSE